MMITPAPHSAGVFYNIENISFGDIFVVSKEVH